MREGAVVNRLKTSLSYALSELKLKQPKDADEYEAEWKAKLKEEVWIQRSLDVRSFYFPQEGMPGSVFLGMRHSDAFLFDLTRMAIEGDPNNFLARLAVAFADVRPTRNYSVG